MLHPRVSVVHLFMPYLGIIGYKLTMSTSEVTMQYHWTSHSQMSKKIESDVSCLDALEGPSGNS